MSVELKSRGVSSFRNVAPNTTLSLQGQLRRFPVPNLANSLEKFAKTVPQFLSEAEYSQFEANLEDFRNSDGPKLQKALEEKAKSVGDGNWLAEYWQNVAYLDYR